MNDLQHTIVYYDPQAYSCFPDILRATGGSLWVTFRRAGGFSLEALRRGKYDHVDKGARIGLARSTDGGQTWQELPGLRQHDTAGIWQPGAGGLCLHTIILDPANPDRIVIAISAAGAFRSDDAHHSTATNCP